MSCEGKVPVRFIRVSSGVEQYHAISVSTIFARGHFRAMRGASQSVPRLLEKEASYDNGKIMA
jgi:hypothetical protein